MLKRIYRIANFLLVEIEISKITLEKNLPLQFNIEYHISEGLAIPLVISYAREPFAEVFIIEDITAVLSTIAKT